MAITLRNMSTRRAYTCGTDEWRRCLQAARAVGWDEEGTHYDLEYQIDDTTDEQYDYLYNLWMIFHASREWREWNGGYDEAKNQIVSDRDALFLRESLETAADDGLLAFLAEGSFRICDE